MKNFSQFQDNFKKRYDAYDQVMFNSPHFKFNFDDEVNAVEQACAFVAQVCEPILVPGPASPNDLTCTDATCTDEDLFLQA
jgi:hypothetical protein